MANVLGMQGVGEPACAAFNSSVRLPSSLSTPTSPARLVPAIMSTYDHSRVAQFIGESFRTPSASEQGVTAIIGGNTLEKAPSGPVTDFVKQHGGHTVITKVRRVEMACAEGFRGRGRGPGGIRSRRGKPVMRRTRRACHDATRPISH